LPSRARSDSYRSGRSIDEQAECPQAVTDAPRFLIVGAGLTGAVIGRQLADAGCVCDIYDEVDHVAGHCHTAYDRETGILVHQFGPHTLHTDKTEIWQFLERFVEIYPYRHKKQAWAGGRIYPIPINLQTINEFFGVNLTAAEAPEFLRRQAEPLDRPPQNFEEAGLAAIGRRLYDAFYRGYTIKQWGRDPTELPAFVFGRLPVHFGDDRNVFHHARQGQPVGGYTHMVERMLDHPNIHVHLGRSFDGAFDRGTYRHLFYSGPIDRFFDWRFGRLAYRTLDFKLEKREGEFQSCGTVNYCDIDVPYTRVAEHKHFWPWEKHDDTVISYEFSRECGPGDTPYYPIRLTKSDNRFAQYVELAPSARDVSFVGRLGTYRYIDMDVAIGDAMTAGQRAIEALRTGAPIPTFFVEPLALHRK
jgi:UDP-galactopyranose mutase